ncbi:hypothetical protein MtrunA17_Chr5g0424431 [Medicago truncatula]|uniref:Uncharacterized protein n=1 Tax=Medicago truncatula TaxID=3880 RepID=A0A396HRJ2_MEDTR|nr:hypothetical protein MtrunA17_Chr5g0424431 [Medicago truncatula]
MDSTELLSLVNRVDKVQVYNHYLHYSVFCLRYKTKQQPCLQNCTLKMGMNLKFILQRTTPKSGKGSLVDNQRISNDSLDVLIISTSLSRLYIKE